MTSSVGIKYDHLSPSSYWTVMMMATSELERTRKNNNNKSPVTPILLATFALLLLLIGVSHIKAFCSCTTLKFTDPELNLVNIFHTHSGSLSHLTIRPWIQFGPGSMPGNKYIIFSMPAETSFVTRRTFNRRYLIQCKRRRRNRLSSWVSRYRYRGSPLLCNIYGKVTGDVMGNKYNQARTKHGVRCNIHHIKYW